MAGEFSALNRQLDRLRELGVIPAAAAVLERTRSGINPELRATVLAEIPAFTTSANPDVLPELAAQSDAHLSALCELWQAGRVGDFRFVREHARTRAEQRFPLEAVLHAYRCGHKVAASWLRDAAIAVAPSKAEQAVACVADFAIEYTNAISTIMAAEYVEQTRLLAEVEGDRRSELLKVLVSGYDESDGRVARLLKRAGLLEQRQAFCVTLVQSADRTEMESAARVQRIIKSTIDAVRELPVRILTGVNENAVVCISYGTRRLSGWTAPQAQLADRISSALRLLGPSVLVGVSNDQPSTSFIPKGVQEATKALDFANLSDRVIKYNDLSIRHLLLHGRGDELHGAMPSWLAELSAADRKTGGALFTTLRAYADCDMNAQRAARKLSVHPNTLYARMQRIDELTGLECRGYHDLTEILLAADCGPDQ